MKLNLRIVIFILMVTTLPLVGATYLIWQTWHKDRQEQQQLNVGILMERTKNHLILTQQTAQFANKLLAAENEVIRYLQTNNDLVKYGFLHASVLDHFSTLQELRNEIDAIVLYSQNKQGQWEKSIEFGAPQFDPQGLNTAAMSGSEALFRWYECPPRALPCLQVITPVFAHSRRVHSEAIGLLATQILSAPNTREDEIKQGVDGLHFHLARSDGSLFSSHDDISHLPLPESPEYHSLNGKEYILQATPVSADLWLVASQPAASFDGSIRTVTLNLVLFCLLVTLLGVISLSLLLRRQYLKPLAELSNALQKISDGDFSGQLAPRSGELGGLIRVFENMRERIQQSNSQIRNLAYKDPLTGLPNRRQFSKVLQDNLQRSDHKHALLYLDLDHFKHVNDSLGHMAGDELIQGVANRIRHCLKSMASILEMPEEQLITARVGGDEFLILMSNLERASDAGRCAQMIIESVQDTFELHGHQVTVSASIGIATCPQDATSATELLRMADLAMYHAKAQGKNNYKFYTTQLNESADEQLLLKTKLREAIKNRELRLYYQPKIDLITGEIVGAEALTRWSDPELGDISPERFLKIAEEHGLMGEFTGWVVKESCRQLNQWKDIIGLNFQLAINVSYRDISGPYLPIIVQEALREYDVGPECLILEITESGLLSGDQNPVNILTEIRGLGCDIALDDFGTGYSSLSYLRHLPVDEIKVDRSFILDLERNPSVRHIIEAISKLGKTLNMQITAEGIETLDQLKLVTSLGCDVAQGALFSMPITPDSFEEILENRRAPDWDHVFQSLDQAAASNENAGADEPAAAGDQDSDSGFSKNRVG